MNCKAVVSGLAFAILFLSALFLYLRDYPSDRTFSVTFILAGGVLLWFALAKAEAETDHKIECSVDKTETTQATNEHDEHHEHGSIAGEEQEITEGGGERMGEDKGE